jgi:hypothetical protein
MWYRFEQMFRSHVYIKKDSMYYTILLLDEPNSHIQYIYHVNVELHPYRPVATPTQPPARVC